MKWSEAVPQLHRLRFQVGRAYPWQEGRELTLVDAGPVNAAAEIEDAIRRLQLRPEDIRRIVLAHCHRDHIGAGLPRHGVLFTGDSVAAVGRVTLGVFNTDRARALASLRRLAALAPATVCFGHGDPLTESAAAALKASADRDSGLQVEHG